MIQTLIGVVELVALLGCVGSSIYYVFVIRSAFDFIRDTPPTLNPNATEHLLPVSVLKPLKGIDPEIYASFRSHCEQDYPDYEIIFGVSEPDDAAIEAVTRLQHDFPTHKIQLVICDPKLGANIKVSNLAQMVRVARHEHLLVNDSDILVGPDYLRRVVTPLVDPNVGMVTCLYRGIAASTLGSRLESLGISTDFSAGVLVARSMEGGLRFGLGSTLAFRRRDLERAGGFQSLADFLADDYELGRRIAGLVLEVRLADTVVETHLPPYDLKGYFLHQLRWARGIRDSRRAGYIGLAFTFGLLWALLAVTAANGSTWSWMMFAVVVALRSAVAWVVGRKVLQDVQMEKNSWLIPLRDFMAVAIWIVSFAGHTVTWRGDRFELKNGRLRRIPN